MNVLFLMRDAHLFQEQITANRSVLGMSMPPYFWSPRVGDYGEVKLKPLKFLRGFDGVSD